MTDERTPRSKWYDGPVYGHLVEPLLSGVHGIVVEALPPGPRVLEACCGTGGLARRIAATGREVLGVDLAPANIALARSRQPPDLSVRFEVGDVAALPLPEAGPYDVATIVMALHEMPATYRLPVLERLLLLAGKVLVVDFVAPMPWSVAGVRNRSVEFAAGPEHFGGFRSFQAQGGLPELVERAGARTLSERRLDSGTLHLALLQGS